MLVRGIASLRGTTLSFVTKIIGATTRRSFNTLDRTQEEKGYSAKLRDIAVISGHPRPCEKEGEWRLSYPLAARMEIVISDILTKAGWKEPEIKRELSQIFSFKEGGVAAATGSWITVEEFQRTPWYARYKPNDNSTTHFVSIECMKLLEETLIPPSQRKDPYAHLRKRHYEDQWFHERFSEDAVKHLTREQLARVTPGMDEYGTVSRKNYLQFCKEYDKRNKDKKFVGVNEKYHAWRSTMGGQNS